MKVLKIGLKIWSTNEYYVNSIWELKKEGFIDYVELFVDPDSSAEHLDIWRGFGMPFLLHAPHSYAGLNFAVQENERQNRVLIKKVDFFDKGLRAEKIIFHPGTSGTLDEAIRQIKVFKEEFPGVFNKAVIENKPRVGLGNEWCIGASHDEIFRIKEETGCGFCFDIAHALCFASWAKKPWQDVLYEFLKLEPEVFHLCDGDVGSVHDNHCHLGEGNYELEEILSMIPENGFLSIETKKGSKDNLDDFKEDVDYLRRCLENKE